MVAVIKHGKSLHRIFNYNENKVKQGVARCLLASNYPMETQDLSLAQKLNMLLNRAKLNENVKNNSVHISLNFAKGEHLDDGKLRAIAEEYMERIGFGSQPFLVYRHEDASHPHIHIITTKIQADGTRIDTQNIGKNRSGPARIAIEQKYNLVPATGRKSRSNPITPVAILAGNPGGNETKNAIAKVLDAVLESYAYTSVPELNAMLKNYNVCADRGKEGSRVYGNKGLYYRVLDGKGEKILTPIKASLFYRNPGLKYLEKQFRKNEIKRSPHKKPLKETIDKAIVSGAGDLEKLSAKLAGSQVQLVCRYAKDGRVFGLTYIDHKNRCVFNGSKLGKDYSAKPVQERLRKSRTAKHKTPTQTQKERYMPTAELPVFNSRGHFKPVLMELLLQAENYYEALPYQLKKTRRKRRKRKQNI
ncbi:relaxase/mobilization nuclease domain-containing protein [Pelobium manganitolerans]|uniref:relaxase/mobilization nuclease domain-containing protein n=1 Tax=Pelobium manganitolerans TaxID=1842495 RepID=UPI003FA34497